MKKYSPYLLIFFVTAVFYLPILLKPDILTNRGNDLSEFFWPIFYFTKQCILNFHQLPFWNNLFFSGTPLLPDPQAPIFYPPNILFLISKNIDSGFVISAFSHIFIAGIGMYLLAKKGFKFSLKTSLFCSFLYICSPKLSGYIEAGHYGLITSWAWLPFAFLTAILLAKRPEIKTSIFLAISLALIFYSHILIFAITVVAVSILYFYVRKNPIPILISGVLCFGLIAIAFLPQLSWQSETTRNLLLNNPDVYPKWLGFTEFLKAGLSPIVFGQKFVWNLDSEKIIGIGLLPSLFASYGFIKLKFKHKLIFSVVTFLIILISLNNLSPIYEFLIKQNWYILLRVSTRLWFLVVFISIFLAGYGFEKLDSIKNIKFLVCIISILAILELILTSWTRILIPIISDPNLAPKKVYEFLSLDKSQFRVFCLNKCLSQKLSAIYGLELVEGYGTLQQKNYYTESEQLSQSFYRNRYTLSIPPFEIFEFESLQPYSPNLAAFNVKYIISNHILKDKNLKEIKQIGNYLIYENEINIPRSNYPISHYSPNSIVINTSNYKTNQVILSEVFNKDWQAFLNGNKETTISETPDKTREVYIKRSTRFVTFIYNPISFRIGILLTFLAIFIIIVIFPRFSNKKSVTPKTKDS